MSIYILTNTLLLHSLSYIYDISSKNKFIRNLFLDDIQKVQQTKQPICVGIDIILVDRFIIVTGTEYIFKLICIISTIMIFYGFLMYSDILYLPI